MSGFRHDEVHRREGECEASVGLARQTRLKAGLDSDFIADAMPQMIILSSSGFVQAFDGVDVVTMSMNIRRAVEIS